MRKQAKKMFLIKFYFKKTSYNYQLADFFFTVYDPLWQPRTESAEGRRTEEEEEDDEEEEEEEEEDDDEEGGGEKETLKIIRKKIEESEEVKR